MNLKNVLILSPHYDDGILACGGTIAKLTDSNDVSIDYLVFAPRSPEYEHEILHSELLKAASFVGVDEVDIRYFNFKTREFPRNRQSILDKIFKLNKEKNFTMIFTPTRFDVHQDHQTVTNELLRVYKRLPTSIFGYELLLNTFSFDTSVFCGFGEEQMGAKLKAFDCFKTQMSRTHFSRQLFESTARVRGAQMGADYAEAFEAIRVII